MFDIPLLVVLSLLNSVASLPTTPVPTGRRIPIGSQRRSFMQRGLDADLFNPAFATHDFSAVQQKYELASTYLQNKDLLAPLRIPLANEFPSFQVPTSFPASEPASMSAQSTSLNADSQSLPLVPSLGVGSAPLPLVDYHPGAFDVMYYGPLQFGTPSQRFTVEIDTGSAELWIASNCGACNDPQYEPLQSKTYSNLQDRFSVRYGSGFVSGTMAQDVVDLSGLIVPNQRFGTVHTVSNNFLSKPNTGLIGFAFGNISSTGSSTFMENLMAQNEVLAPYFSVYITRNQEKGSELCVGCYDASKAKGDIVWLPVVSKSWWTVQFQGITINSNAVQPTDTILAVVDTGTSLIYLPHSLATAFYNQIPGSRQAEEYGQGFWTIPCSEDTEVAINLGNNTFSINREDFNLGMVEAGSTECMSGILSLGPGYTTELVVLGDGFLKSWYSIFDYSNGVRVGLAPSINNA